MRRRIRLVVLLASLLAGALLLGVPRAASRAQAPEGTAVITGTVHGKQGQVVEGAAVRLVAQGTGDELEGGVTQADGRFALMVPETVPDDLVIHVERAHYEDMAVVLDPEAVEGLRQGQPVALPDIHLLRQVNASFWIATLIFAGMLALIGLGKLHNTLTALLGVTLIFFVSYLGGALNHDLFILDFSGALRYVDWNVIFLIMGMMIIIAAVERTGLFQWLAYNAYRLSGGRVWLLIPILMLVTGVTSAMLDNVTTMLLMTPITVQIALTLGISPLALLMPEVMASNVVGISTLIGTPTNILIGSFAKISFNGFLSNLTPGVLLAFVGLVIYSELVYRGEIHGSESEEVSHLLLERLAERAKITEPEDLKKAGVVGAFMLLLFITGEHVHLVPAVTAIMGATVLLIWTRPDIDEMIEEVDWTTLVFFMALFIVVGAVQEVGLVSVVADVIGRLVAGNLVVAILVVTWSSALLSTVIANIPFTAAMLPVVGYLTATVPGAHSKVIFYCLSVGSGMGGNGSLIGASANMVTAGISERAGYPISFAYFLKKGLPALLITVGLGTIWLLLRFIVFPGTAT